jgi:hypothetical protein
MLWINDNEMNQIQSVVHNVGGCDETSVRKPDRNTDVVHIGAAQGSSMLRLSANYFDRAQASDNFERIEPRSRTL